MRRLLATLALALGLAGCAPQALVPTPTPVPTATPLPTATPTPAASPTPAPDAAATIRAALDRTARADVYTLAVGLVGSGALGGVELGENERELLSMTGAFAGESYRFSLRGFLAGFIGADPQRGLEAMQVDGERYVRGPIGFLGATEPDWYRLSAAQAALANPPIDAAGSLALLRDSDADFSRFTPGGEDRVGDQRCAVYLGDYEATMALVGSLAESGLPATDTQQITTAESYLVVCPDGYLHRIATAFSGEQPGVGGAPAAPYSYRLSVELSGFDAPVALDAPGNALELPAGPSGPGLPRPTAVP